MYIEKNKILQVLRSRGQHHRADWVDRQLPDQVDAAHNVGLLATLHLTAADLATAQGPDLDVAATDADNLAELADRPAS